MQTEPDPNPTPLPVPLVLAPRVPRAPQVSFALVWMALALGLTAWALLLALVWVAWL